MTMERIFIRQSPVGPQTEREFVEVVAGAGIKGDRYFDRHDEPGQNITLIEAEEVESFTSEYQRAPDLSVSNRNIVTRGVRPNDLVGREFMIGDIRLRGVELCEPCLGIGKSLASPELSAAHVVKRLLHKAGLRADVLSSGSLARGAKITNAA